MKGLILYSRPGCGLCEDLEEALHAEFAGRFQLEWRDVDRDQEARRRYSPRIPLLLSTRGEELCEGKLDVVRVAAYLGGPQGPV